MDTHRSLRQRLQSTVLEAGTPAGKAYNAVIFGAILLSVLALLLEPDPLGNSALRQTNVPWIDLVQNVCLAVFAADFVLHLALVERPRRYLFSFTGLIDASAVLFFFVPQVRSELLLWVFKFGRILRVFKLLKFIDEARVLGQALRGSARTIGVFLFFVFLLQVVLGYSIFVIESARPDSQFQTVASGVYWAIVTMTTVGYGDVVPQTELGRLLASVVMLLGFGIIAIPTGILTVSGCAITSSGRLSWSAAAAAVRGTARVPFTAMPSVRRCLPGPEGQRRPRSARPPCGIDLWPPPGLGLGCSPGSGSVQGRRVDGCILRWRSGVVLAPGPGSTPAGLFCRRTDGELPAPPGRWRTSGG